MTKIISLSTGVQWTFPEVTNFLISNSAVTEIFKARGFFTGPEVINVAPLKEYGLAVAKAKEQFQIANWQGSFKHCSSPIAAHLEQVAR